MDCLSCRQPVGPPWRGIGFGASIAVVIGVKRRKVRCRENEHGEGKIMTAMRALVSFLMIVFSANALSAQPAAYLLAQIRTSIRRLHMNRPTLKKAISPFDQSEIRFYCFIQADAGHSFRKMHISHSFSFGFGVNASTFPAFP